MAKFVNKNGSGASSAGLNKMLRGQNSSNNGQFYMQRAIEQRAIEHETSKKKDTEQPTE